MEDYLFLTKILKVLQCWNPLGSQTCSEPSHFYLFFSSLLALQIITNLSYGSLPIKKKKNKNPHLNNGFEIDFLQVIIAHAKLIVTDT